MGRLAQKRLAGRQALIVVPAVEAASSRFEGQDGASTGPTRFAVAVTMIKAGRHGVENTAFTFGPEVTFN
jgi:hypothetical protein